MAARRDYDDIIQIDLELDEPSRSSPALGQIDRMLKRSALETQSLHVVRRLMMRDMLDRAQVTGVTKLTAAAGLREQHTLGLPPAEEQNGNGYHPKTKTKTKKVRGQYTNDRAAFAKSNITGPRLNLFILERLGELKRFVAGEDILRTLKETGKADHIRRLSGVFGLLSMEKLVKHTDKGYRITSAGLKFAPRLRTRLEEGGELLAGQYTAPPDYKSSTPMRLGYTSVKTWNKGKKVKP